MARHKSFIVTGAAGGLGRQAARLLAEQQANVLCVDLQASGLEKLQQELAKSGADVDICVADVTRQEDVARYVEVAVKRFGGVDGAFHIAGWEGAMKEFVEVDVDEFDKMMAVNARSVWYGMKSLVPVLLQGGGGRIVNTGSYVAFHGTRRTAAYGAAKHAVVGMTRGVALELAAQNISVNVIAPGAMDTRMIRTVWARNSPDDLDRGREMTIERIPRRRLADPEDVAAIAIWLLTDAPMHLTGQLIPIDGGTSI